MVRKILQAGGLLALLAFTGSGVAAWALVKDRLAITIQEESAAAQRGGEDPMAGLREDLRQVQTEVRALGASTARNLETLAKGLDQGAGERHDATQAGFADLQARIERLAAALRAQETRVGELARAVDDAASAARAQRAAGEPVAESRPGIAAVPRGESEARPGAAPGGAGAAAAQAPAPPAESPPPPAAQGTPASRPAGKRSFLAFEVPQDPFRFDQRQTFEVVPSLSRVGFDAKSTLHDFTGVTSKVQGTLTVNLADAGSSLRGEVVAEAKTLTTGLPDRDAAMCEHLDTAHHDAIRYEITGFEPTRVDAAKESVAGTVKGRMTIRGETRELVIPVTAAIDASRRLEVRGETTIRLDEYKVPVPSKLGLIKMAPEVKVWVALRARCTGKAAE
ncbi:MAG: YceI family protein [Planctomycetes bacterium]|nr:YceI family protein [Planctomycetota bacterium]